MRAPLLLGAVALAVLSGCADGSKAAPTTVGAAFPATTAASPNTTTATTPAPETTNAQPTPPAPTESPATTAAPAPPPDAMTVLQQSLDQAAFAGYHFVTTATVNGTVALVVEGDRVGTGTRMRLTSQGQTVDYIVLPEGTWATQSGEWQELEQPQTLGDPVAALRTPQSLAVTSHTPELTVIDAVYAGADLGLPTPDPVGMVIELTGTTLTAMSYTAPDGSTVRAEFSPLTDATPVSPPTA